MRHARAAAARLWELDGSPEQLKKNELASLLIELQAVDGTINPTDGKRERLIPAFHDHADKLGCWENMVCALWEPPAEEMDEIGRKKRQRRTALSNDE